MKHALGKKLSIVGLSFVVALTTGVGVALTKKTVDAENNTTIETKSIVSATGATVQYANGTDGTDGAGIQISSSTAYSGKIKGVFEGDTSITFKFTDESDGSVYGNFVFRIADVLDDSKYFDVEYSVISRWVSGGVNKGYTGAYVIYDGEYRSSRYYQSDDQWYNAKSGDQTICGPNFLKRNADIDGKLTLDFDDNGVLSVLVTKHNDIATERVIAAFDGTEEFVNTQSWGLPKMEFENGYTISISSTVTDSTTDLGSDVLFKSVTTGGTTYSLGQETIAKPVFVTAYEEYEDYLAELEAKKEALEARKAEIPKTLTATNATATWGEDAKGNTGMKLEGATNQPYTANFGGYFKGSTTIKFAIPHNRDTWNTKYDNMNLCFIVKDLAGNEVFTVRYYTSGGDYTRAVVEYNDGTTTQIRSHGSQANANSDNTGWGEAYIFNDGYGRADSQNMGPGLSRAKAARIPADLQIKITNDVVSVWAYEANKEQMYEIGAFDGTNVTYTDNWNDVDDGSFKLTPEEFQGWNLPKIYDRIKDGYQIEMQTSYNQQSEDYPHDIDVTVISVDAADYFQTVKLGDQVTNVTYKEAVTLTAPATEAGKVFLGWKDVATNKLYKANAVIENVTNNMTFEAIELTYGMADGASVRLDTSGNGTSGIRFMVAFDKDEYEAVKGYIQSMGTLILPTEYLTGADGAIDFILDNFVVGETIAKVENTKGVYEYTLDGASEASTVYSAALTQIKNYAREFSARGYLVVEYADGTTETIYTAYDVAKNSRSIAQVAYLLQNDQDAYENLTAAQKAIIDAFAEAYQN